MLIMAAVGLVIAFGPIVAIILARRALGPQNAAAALVVWGLLIAAGEHAGFAIGESQALAGLPGVSAHMRYHFFMAGIFTVVGAVALCTIALTLLRERRPAGWYALLFALLFGGGFELSGGAGTLFHGFPPSWPVGLVIYAYPAAWAAALAIAYRPVFGESTRQEVSHEGI